MTTYLPTSLKDCTLHEFGSLFHLDLLFPQISANIILRIFGRSSRQYYVVIAYTSRHNMSTTIGTEIEFASQKRHTRETKF